MSTNAVFNINNINDLHSVSTIGAVYPNLCCILLPVFMSNILNCYSSENIPLLLRDMM